MTYKKLFFFLLAISSIQTVYAKKALVDVYAFFEQERETTSQSLKTLATKNIKEFYRL